MKKSIVILMTLAVCVLLAAGPAGAFDAREIQVWIFSGNLRVLNAGAGNVVTARLFDRTMLVKGTAVGKAGPDGTWIQDFPPGVWVLPGDTLSVDQSGLDNRSHTIEAIVIDSLDPTADTVSGHLKAGRSTAYVEVVRTNLNSSRSTYTNYGAVNADGSFLVDLAAHDLKRLDDVRVGYADYIFNVRLRTAVPGVLYLENGNQLNLAGPLGQSYTLRLLDGTGVLRDKATLTVAERPDLWGRTIFAGKDGAPVAIRAGDTIDVKGKGGFQAVVPPLAVTSVDVAANKITIQTYPGAGVGLEVRRYADDGSTLGLYASPSELTADGSGVVTHTCPVDVRRLDLISVAVLDEEGNLARLLHQIP
jgi:hypothetical protein